MCLKTPNGSEFTSSPPCMPTGSLMRPLLPYLVHSSRGLNHRTSSGLKNMNRTTAFPMCTRLGYLRSNRKSISSQYAILQSCYRKDSKPRAKSRGVLRIEKHNTFRLRTGKSICRAITRVITLFLEAQDSNHRKKSRSKKSTNASLSCKLQGTCATVAGALDLACWTQPPPAQAIPFSVPVHLPKST
jgi:hypothetical protein